MTIASYIRKTINMLEASNIEYVAGRDFDKEEETVVNGTTYALGNTRHEDSNVSKNDFSIYKKVRDGGFEYKDKFYPQEFYVEVGTLDVSPYAKRDEVLQAYNEWLKTNKG